MVSWAPPPDILDMSLEWGPQVTLMLLALGSHFETNVMTINTQIARAAAVHQAQC